MIQPHTDFEPARYCQLCGIPLAYWKTRGKVEHEVRPTHRADCPYYWHYEGEPTIVLRLNPYQAANLLWALREIESSGRHNELYTGDWNGEVVPQLEAKMRQAGGEFVTRQPNGANTGWEV